MEWFSFVAGCIYPLAKSATHKWGGKAWIKGKTTTNWHVFAAVSFVEPMRVHVSIQYKIIFVELVGKRDRKYNEALIGRWKKSVKKKKSKAQRNRWWNVQNKNPLFFHNVTHTQWAKNIASYKIMKNTLKAKWYY